MNQESDKIVYDIMSGIIFPDKTYVPSKAAMQKMHDLTTAEIDVHRIISDPQKRPALFVPKNVHEFFCLHRDKFFGFKPEDFIVYGDAAVEIEIKWGDVYNAHDLKIAPSSVPPDKLFYWSCQQNPNNSNPSACERYNLNNFENFKPSGKYQFFPLLGLLAMKWSIIRDRDYSIEMVAEELFECGFATRSEPLTSMRLPAEDWTETLSGPLIPSKNKLAYIGVEPFLNPVRATGMRGLWFEDAQGAEYCYPVTYWQHKAWLLPTSFLSAPPHKMPLYRPNIEDETPIVVTEFLEIASTNYSNNKIAVVSWLGGETGIPRTDLTPLLGKTFYYLLKLADNEKDGKRAVKVMLKFLSALREQGFFHFKILDTIYHDIIDEKRIGLLYKRYQVEIPDNLADENCGIDLNWQPSATVGATILGQSVQEGRILQIHGPSGTGKSLIVQGMVNILIRGDSPDFGEPLSFQHGRQFKVLYIQVEMQEGDVPLDDMLLRQKRFDGLFGKPLPSGMLTYYKPADDICKLSEQEAIVSKLAELDPEGKSQWVIVIDNILSVMPSATTKSGYDKIKPWFEALKALGITIFLVHHDNNAGDGYGTSTILNHMDSSWHMTLTDQARDEIIQALPNGIRNDLSSYYKLQDATEALSRMNSAVRKVYFKVDKGRHTDMNPFFIQWTLTDAEQNLKAEYSDYSNLEALVKKMLLEYKTKLECTGEENDKVPNCEIPGPAIPSEVKVESSCSSGEQACSPVPAYAGELPATFTALKGLDKAIQRLALLELRLQCGSIKSIAHKLGCSESSIETMCREHGINKKAVEAYAAGKDIKSQ